MRTVKTDQTWQADLCHRWAYLSFCWFCRAVAQINVKSSRMVSYNSKAAEFQVLTSTKGYLPLAT